jgi:hypothetical protein
MRDINPRNWFGIVTIENIGEVVEAIRTFLTIDGTPRYYTFVAVNETTGRCTDVRTSQRINSDNHNGLPLHLSYSRTNPDYDHNAPYDSRVPWSFDCDGPEGADNAHFSVADSYGSWGFSTYAHDTDTYDERGKRGTGVVFADGQLKIEQLNGLSEVLLWVIAPEQHRGEPYWTDDGTSYRYNGMLELKDED